MCRNYRRIRRPEGPFIGRISIPDNYRNTRLRSKIWQKPCPHCLSADFLYPQNLDPGQAGKSLAASVLRPREAGPGDIGQPVWPVRTRSSLRFYHPPAAHPDTLWSVCRPSCPTDELRRDPFFFPLLGTRRTGPAGRAGRRALHPRRKPVVPVRYVGWLSRFGGVAQHPPEAPADTGRLKDEAPAADRDRPDAAPDLLVLLSGPEPQRSLLEKTILDQSASLDARIVVVRGLPGGPASGHDQPKPSGLPSTPLPPIPTLPSNVEVFNHLPAAELNDSSTPPS